MIRIDQKTALQKREREIMDVLGSEEDPKKQKLLSAELLWLIEGRWKSNNIFSRLLFCMRGRG